MSKYPLKLSLLSLVVVVGCFGGARVASAQGGGMVQAAAAANTADMETVKARLIAAQIVTDAAALQTLARDAARFRDTMGVDGKWADLTYADTGPGEWGPSQHLDHVLMMTRAYATPGQPLYHDATLRRKIDVGLDVFFAGHYLNANWWYNDIGVPIKIGPILLLLGDSLSPERRAQGLTLLKRSEDDKPMRGSTGANLSWLARIQLMRGLAEPSPARVAESFDTLWSEIKISPPDKDGIQADTSFHQHGPLVYNGGYGMSFIGDATNFVSYARGTRFALPADKERILVNLVLDGQDWMAWGNDFDPGVRGRDITREGGGSPSNWRQVVTQLAGVTTVRHDELLAMARRSEPGGAKLVGNRNFWDSGFMVQRRTGYYTSVRTHSTRTRNTDGASKTGGPINREGRVSHHVADGATYIWRRGDEYKGIAPVWNWQLVPGTTAQQLAALDQEHVAFKGGSSFAGGVSDGMYGAATIDLQRGGLRAQKSWFYFDDEFVALGTGISDTSGNAVVTSVNQSVLNGEVRLSSLATPLQEGDHTEAGARWILHDGTGYLFPANTPIRVANRVQSGHWSDIGTGSRELVSKGVFTLSLEHGVKPSGATYEYTVVPGASVADLNKRLVSSPVETLSNTPDLQVVRHNGLKILEAVFHRAGQVNGGAGWNVRVDQPCLVIVRDMGDGMEVSVANPENKALPVNLEIDRKLTGEGATVNGETTAIHFDLPEGLMAGSSVVRRFAKD